MTDPIQPITDADRAVLIANTRQEIADWPSTETMGEELILALDARLTVTEAERDTWRHRALFEQRFTEEMRKERDDLRARLSVAEAALVVEKAKG